MQPYLICLDLDGTLLNDNKEISPYTKQVLTELQQCGHYVMIATGRPYRASQMYYHELNMNTLWLILMAHLCITQKQMISK